MARRAGRAPEGLARLDVQGVADAGRGGWTLRVDRHLSHSVAQLLALTGAADYLWLSGRARQAVGDKQPYRCLRRPAEHSARRLQGSGGRPPYGRRPSIRPGH